MMARTHSTFKRPSPIIGPFVPETPASKKALVVGSSGVLGREIVQQLQHQQDMKVLQADVVIPGSTTTTMTNQSTKKKGGGYYFCDLSKCSTLSDLTITLSNGVGNFLEPRETLDVVVCAAGGWMGNPSMPTMDNTTSNHNSRISAIADHARVYGETFDQMFQRNVDPVVATSFLIPYYLSRESLIIMIGATAALQPTPDMIAYGMAKAATHFAIQTLGAMTTHSSLEVKSVRDRAVLQYPVSVIGLLPTIIDTPHNRETMLVQPPPQQQQQHPPGWTPPRDIARQIGEWVQTPALRPHSGALIKVFTNQRGETTFSIVK